MAKEIRMPKLGQTSEEVHLVRWRVAVGDSVRKGDPLCEVETDKTTMDLESFTDGTVLQLLAQPGTEVAAGALIALIGEPGETQGAVPAPTQAARSAAVAVPPIAHPAAGTNLRATRMVRTLAQKQGIDLAKVRGTGPGGLVTRADLAKAKMPESASRALAASGASATLSDQQIRLGRLMAESKMRIPHYYVESTVFCDRMLELRQITGSGGGEKPAVDTFFIFAAASVLARFPRINSSFREESLHASTEINIAFALSVEGELCAPVIRAADKKNREAIEQELKRFTASARGGTLERADTTGATFTISNLGMYPVDSFQAIITPPQVAVLAIGRIRNVLDIQDGGSFRVRPACTIWGSFDHRAVNGAEGAEFLRALKRFIEEEIT